MSLIRHMEYDADARIPEDLMRLIALLISVMDLPHFIMTSRWFAQYADKWWQFHTARIFGEHPPRLFPKQIAKNNLNWHGFFFDRYFKLDFDNWNMCYRRRVLLIMDGNIEQLRYELREGIKYKTWAGGSITMGNYLSVEGIFDDRFCEKSLLAAAHSTSPENKQKALDFFYEFILEHECKHKTLSENRLTIIRNALELFPELTCRQYYLLSTHVIKNSFCSPVADALFADCYATTLMLLQCGADLNEPIESGGYFTVRIIPSALEYLISRVAELVNHPLHSRAREGGKPKEGVNELIDYCRLHFNDLLKEAVAKLAEPAKTL